jgi:hypothetical protein
MVWHPEGSKMMRAISSPLLPVTESAFVPLSPAAAIVPDDDDDDGEAGAGADDVVGLVLKKTVVRPSANTAVALTWTGR